MIYYAPADGRLSLYCHCNADFITAILTQPFSFANCYFTVSVRILLCFDLSCTEILQRSADFAQSGTYEHSGILTIWKNADCFRSAFEPSHLTVPWHYWFVSWSSVVWKNPFILLTSIFLLTWICETQFNKLRWMSHDTVPSLILSKTFHSSNAWNVITFILNLRHNNYARLTIAKINSINLLVIIYFLILNFLLNQ